MAIRAGCRNAPPPPAMTCSSLPRFEALVVVNVPGQHEGLTPGQIEVQALDHPRAGAAGIAEGIDRIGQHDQGGRVGAGLVVLAQELLLSRVYFGQLAIDRQQVDLGRQSEGEVARALHRRVARQRQRRRLVDRTAAHELARPVGVVPDHQLRQRRHARSRFDVRARAAGTCGRSRRGRRTSRGCRECRAERGAARRPAAPAAPDSRGRSRDSGSPARSPPGTPCRRRRRECRRAERSTTGRADPDRAARRGRRPGAPPLG